MNYSLNRTTPGAGSIFPEINFGSAPGHLTQMKYRFLLFFTLIPLILIINACDIFSRYSQLYIIVINRLKVGEEIINEKTDIKGNLVCLSEQERDTYGSKEKKRRRIRTKMVFPKGKQFPVSYSYESSSGNSYHVKVEDGQIIRTLSDEGESREFVTPLEPDMYMLDLNAFHTIDYWIRKYDAQKGGRQVVQTYLLPAGSVEKLAIIPADIIIPEHDNETMNLKNYEIDIGDGMTIFLWVDEFSRLYRLFFRGPNVEVIRADLYDSINKKKESRDKRF